MRHPVQPRGTAIPPNTRDGDDWRTGAPCTEQDPELFFPVGTSLTAQDQANDAKAVCRRCDVRNVCLEWSLVHQDFGVAGGLTEDERRAYKKSVQRKAWRDSRLLREAS